MDGISIIIPCYNCRDSIIKCLESIQLNHNNIEAIVIDDCSTDDSYSIVYNYKKKYVNYNIVLVRNNTNIGPGESRNYGITLASKNYIMFLDSDDVLTKDYYKTLSSIIKKSYDCIIFDIIFKKNKKNKYLSMLYTKYIKQGLINTKEALVYTRTCTAGKLYKKDLIKKNNIKFANSKTSEDFVFTKTALSNCNYIYYLNKALYIYIYNFNSLTNSKERNKLANEYKYNAYNLIKNSIDNVKYKKELNTIFMLEIIYNSSITRIRNLDCYSNSKKEFLKLLEDYDTNDPYFFRYSYKYKLVFKILRLLYCI